MQEKIQNLRVLVNIPDLESYQDTYRMFLSMATSLEALYIVTTAGQEIPYEIAQYLTHKSDLNHSLMTSSSSSILRALSTIKTIRLIEIPRQSYPRRASSYLLKHMSTINPNIIHDMFGHFAAFCQHYFYQKRPYVMLTTLRTTNFGWFQRVKPLGFNINMHYAVQRVLSLWRDRRIIPHVDRVVVMGPGHEDDVINGHHISTHKITFIPSETNTRLFQTTPEEYEYLCRDSAISALDTLCLHKQRKSMHCIYTGALTRNKGLHILLQAFQSMALHYPKLTLQLIGRSTPFEKDWILQTIKEHPFRSRITLTAVMPRKNLIPIYQSAHLYLFPSLFEGSPRSLREAIACGCVAVASDIPGCRGVDPKGDFIHFTKVNHVVDWIKVWTNALEESPQIHKSRQIKGIQHLKNTHSTHAVAQSYVKLYRELLQEHQQQN